MCALNVAPNNDGSCFSSDHINDLQAALEDIPHGSSIGEIKRVLNCSDDKCILDKVNLPATQKGKIEREALKPETKSFDHNYWLDNTEIDTILSQFRRQFPGFAHSFIHMIDLKTFEPANVHTFDYPVHSVTSTDFGQSFNPNNTESKLSTWDNVPLKSYGVVCNTDSSSGSGQHWFAVFISCDRRDPNDTSKPYFTIEVFNSAGGGVQNKAFNSFWEYQAQAIAKATGLRCEYIDHVSNIVHQSPNTGNCGSYSLFYIYCRLMGEPSSEFDNPSKPISDASMRKFREFCFRLKTNSEAKTQKKTQKIS
jgi:hypothetical protein